MRNCEANNCIYPVFSHNYCRAHQYLRKDEKYDRRTVFQKHMDKMKNGKKGVVEVVESELQKWYSAIMEREEGRCWETGERIDKKNKRGWYGSISHILPKNDYPSVATHPQNYMILKMWGGTHGQYDSSWEKAAKMKIWPYACKIINILYPLLTKEEKRKLPEIIIQEIDPKIYNQ